MHLGEHIYRLRTERNMSQEALAEALEVSRQSVSKWENNSAVPELEKLVRLSEVFGVTLDELVLEKKTPREAPPETPEVRTVYVEKSPAWPVRKTVGVILLCFSGLVFLVLSVLAGLLGGLLFAAPFAVCGVICLLAAKHPGLWCAWTGYLWVDLYLRFASGVSWQFLFWGLRYDGMGVQTVIAACELLLLVALLWVTGVKLGPAPRETVRKQAVKAAVLWGIFLLSWIPLGIAVNTPEMIRGVRVFQTVWGFLRNILLLWAVVHTARLIKGRNRKS